MQSTVTKREVPKDLQGIKGMRTGFHVPDVQHQRLVITGHPGSGKSTLLNSNPGLIMLDPDRGGDTVDDPQALRFTPPPNVAVADLDKAYLEFADKIVARKLAGNDDIKMVGIDSLDELIKVFQVAVVARAPEAITHIGDVDGGHGKGYSTAGDPIWMMLDKIHRAGLGWALICQSRSKTITVDGKEKVINELAISDSYKSTVLAKCEHMLFLSRGIVTQPGPDIVTKVGNREIRRPGKRITTPVRKLRTNPGGVWRGEEAGEVKVRVPLSSELVIPKSGGWDVLAADYGQACTKLVQGGE